ncbi:hypothetical protein [Paraburkholderia solisilvae]|uniref:Uncharacterized protein n=1 Tax=Paraburkholderia solisilvae TaxID=624376 RepID=A0A6J5DQZ5_9BURK|nr:hypothetical protein [Paraburkholderia solisilvae]CAB3755701.1 hypothetical protein LMG29739_02255 [Paraburkholderia solisilvae]
MSMTVIAFSLLAVLLVFVCFWRELSPGVAWLALQYHTTPEVLASLYTGGDTHVDEEAQRRAAVLAEQELRVAQAPLVEAEIRAGVEQDLRERAHAPVAADGKTETQHAGAQKKKETASV